MLITQFFQILNIYFIFNILIETLLLIINNIFILKKSEINFTFINFELYTQLL